MKHNGTLSPRTASAGQQGYINRHMEQPMLWLSGGRSFEQAICPGGQPRPAVWTPTYLTYPTPMLWPSGAIF